MRLVLAVMIVGAAGVSNAETHSCQANRTPIEMAGNTLCLLNTAMPDILRREDDSVESLAWSNPERFPPEVKLSPGTFYLIVASYTPIPTNLISPSLANSEPSDLPHMRETTDGLAKLRNTVQNRFHPLLALINGQAFIVETRDAIAQQSAHVS